MVQEGRGDLNVSRIVPKLVCPKCGGGNFLEGPHGGNAVNVKCSNCVYLMTVTPLPRGGFWITDEQESA
jgi:hypothetical protein